MTRPPTLDRDHRVDELVDLLGEPNAAGAATRAGPTLLDVDRDWLAASPFCVMATVRRRRQLRRLAEGRPGGQLVHVIDDRTIALAERPGNKRADGYQNILGNPHVGLNFFIPGRGDTLRINGRARLVSDAPFFDEMVVKGHRPVLAVVVDIERDLLPLRQGVPALRAVEARDLGPRGAWCRAAR